MGLCSGKDGPQCVVSAVGKKYPGNCGVLLSSLPLDIRSLAYRLPLSLQPKPQNCLQPRESTAGAGPQPTPSCLNQLRFPFKLRLPEAHTSNTMSDGTSPTHPWRTELKQFTDKLSRQGRNLEELLVSCDVADSFMEGQTLSQVDL